jgi:hypothetical protein
MLTPPALSATRKSLPLERRKSISGSYRALHNI